GVENSYLRRSLQTGSPHHFDVHPGDGQDGCRTPASGGDSAVKAVGARYMGDRMSGQKGRQVGFDANGSHAGAAATVGYAKCLVKIEVGDVATEFARFSDAYQGVEVGAIHI